MKTVLLFTSMLGLVMNAGGQPPPAGPSTGPGSAAESAASTAAPWLLGKWVFDEEYTRAKHAETQPDDGIPEAAAAVAAQMLEKLKGAKVIVTESEINMTRADGTGKVDGYTVMPSADTNIAQLKQANGEVVVFHREGDRIWMASTGSVNEPFYFKKAQWGWEAHAGPPPLEFRVDPARAAHGFGAWVNQSPWSNGARDGIHYDQNGKPFLRHLPSLDPRNFPYGPYQFFDGTAGETITMQGSEVVNEVVDLRNRSFVPLSGGAKKYIALPSKRGLHTFAIVEPGSGKTTF